MFNPCFGTFTYGKTQPPSSPLLSKLRVEVGTFVSKRIKFDIKKHMHKIYSVIKVRWF